MPLYSIKAPNGKTYEIEGPPGASQAQVVQAIMAKMPNEDFNSPPETTIAGQAKEFVKGLGGGALNLLESAGVGAANVLPEEQEKAVQAAVRSGIGGLRESVAPAPGYEDTVGSKFGQAVGSTLPFFALGALGPVGIAAGAGMGVAAGSGEATTRAQQAGATPEEESRAAMLGAGVGASEILPVFRFAKGLKQVPEGGLDIVKRAALRGGEEAAQEAAANLAQNAIEQGYNPEQELLEGTGESAGYGGATGAFISAITDLALGRRGASAGTQEAPGQPTEAERRKQNKLAQEQAETARKEQEAAELQARMDAARVEKEQQKLRKEQQKSQQQQILDDIAQNQDANALLLRRNELGREETPQAKQAVAAINKRLREIVNEKVRTPGPQEAALETPAASPVQQAREAKKAEESVFAQPEPQQMEIRETVGLPERSITTEEVDDGVAEPRIRPRKDKAQLALPFDAPKRPVELYREALIEPSKFDEGLDPAEPVSLADIARAVRVDMEARPGRINQLFGKTNLPKLMENFVGKTPTEIAAMGQPKGIPLSDIIFGELTKTVSTPEVSDAGTEPTTKPAVDDQQQAPEAGADAGNVPPNRVQRGAPGPVLEQPTAGGVGPGVRDTGDTAGREAVQPSPLGEQDAVQEPSAAQVPARDEPQVGEQVGEEVSGEEPAPQKAQVKVSEGPVSLKVDDFTLQPDGAYDIETDDGRSFNFMMSRNGKDIIVSGVGMTPTVVRSRALAARKIQDFINGVDDSPSSGKVAGVRTEPPKTFAPVKVDDEAVKREIEGRVAKEAASAPQRTQREEDLLAQAEFEADKETLLKDVVGLKKKPSVSSRDITSLVNKSLDLGVLVPAEATSIKRSAVIDKNPEAALAQFERIVKGAKLDIDVARPVAQPAETKPSRVSAAAKAGNPPLPPEMQAKMNTGKMLAAADKSLKAAQNRARQAEKKAEKEAKAAQDAAKKRMEETRKRIEAEEKARVEAEQEAERQAIARMQAEEAAERARKKLEKAEAAQRQAEKDQAAVDRIVDPKIPANADWLKRVTLEAFRPTKNAMRVYNQIKGMDSAQLADWLVDNARSSFDKVVAEKVRSRLADMAKQGVELPVTIVEGQDRFKPEYNALFGARGMVSIEADPKVRRVSMRVLFNGPVSTPNNVSQAGNPTGMQYETILHEMVHAATAFQTILVRKGDGKKYQELRELSNFVVREINKENAKPNPNPFTNAIANDQINALSNPDELLAWGLTNRNAQEYLASLNMGKKTVWEAVVDWMLDMLGLSKSYKSAMSELLRISGSMFEVGAPQIIADVSADTKLKATVATTQMESRLTDRPTAEEAQADLEEVQEATGRTEPYYPQERSVIADAKDYWKSGSKVDIFRNAVIDQASSVARKFSDLYSKGYKDTFGNINPMGLYRQAQAAPQLIQGMLRTGGVAFDAQRGQYATTEVEIENPTSTLEPGTKVNANMILEKIGEMANNLGMEAKSAELLVDTTLRGLRYQWMIDRNQEISDQADKAEAEGKKRLANDLREKMYLLPENDLRSATREAEIAKRNIEKYEDIRQIRDIMNAVRVHAIRQAGEAGRLSPEQVREWSEGMEYVPFDRVREQDEAQSRRKMTSRGLVAFSDVPSLRGSETREIGNIVNNYFNMLGWMTSQTMRNKAATMVLEDMRLADFARKIKDPKAAENEAAVVRVFEDGESVYYELLDEVDVAAFDSLPVLHGSIINGFQKSTRLLRTLVTSMPPFAISQVIQDAQRAAIFSGTKQPFKVMGRTLVNFPTFLMYNALGKKHPLVRELEKIGVVGAYDLNVLNPTEEARIEAGLEKMPKWKSVVRALDKITTTSDLSARAAVYQTILEDTGQDKARAAQTARELINFRRRGTSEIVSWGVAAIPFFNAYIQGMDNIYRSIKGTDAPSALEKNVARAKFFKSMAGAFAIGTAYALLMAGNDEYEEAEDYLKDRAWLLPGGIRIPMPPELGVVFKVLPERIVGYFRREGTEEEQRIMTAVTEYFKDSVWNAYSSPNVTPQLIRPAFEWIANYSFFTGREIVPGSLKDKEAFLQYGSNTSEPARIIGQQLGLSPMKVENFIAGVFGMAGSMAMQFGDAMLTDRGDRPLYKMPLLSTFSYDPIGSKPRTEFYDLAEKINRVKTTFDDLNKTDPDAAIEYLEKKNNMDLYSAAGWREARLQQISRLRALRKFIESDKSMSGEEKRQQLDALRVIEQELNSDVREMAAYLRAN